MVKKWFVALKSIELDIDIVILQFYRKKLPIEFLYGFFIREAMPRNYKKSLNEIVRLEGFGVGHTADTRRVWLSRVNSTEQVWHSRANYP